MGSVLPGDRIASIEEYEAGENAFDDGDMVRSTVVGSAQLDNSSRMASIRRSKRLGVPDPGDTIVGTVAAVMATMIAVEIKYVNGRLTKSNVECICSIRNIRRKNIALVNDVVELKIVSHLNGTIHATMEEPTLGVIMTRCVKCGGSVVPIRDAIKCIECSWIDERKLARKFGNPDFFTLGQQPAE